MRYSRRENSTTVKGPLRTNEINQNVPNGTGFVHVYEKVYATLRNPKKRKRTPTSFQKTT